MQQLLTDGLRRAERLWGNRVATIDGAHATRPEQLTYRELAARVRRLIGALESSGVTAGDRVATLMANGSPYLECYYGVPGAGGIIVPLNSRLSLPELRYILEDAAVHTLITDDTHAELADELAPYVKQAIVGSVDYERRLSAATPGELSVGVQENDLAGLFYTGGTTGFAKGVMLTHRNLVSNAFHIGLSLQYTQLDRYLHVAPMFHLADGASTYAVTWSGGSHVFLPAFDATTVIQTITKHRVTVVLLVPAMLTAIVNSPSAAQADLSSLRLVFHGAAPIATTLLRSSIDTMRCSFAQGYGMTEAAPLVTVLHDEEDLVDSARLRSAGRVIAGVHMQVVRPDGEECDVGEVGEVLVQGPNVMAGYWNKPEETAAALHDGSYWSKDLGYVDDEGYLFLVDRAKDMIITGGENVYSIEVEDALSRHPAVLESAVIGVPDDTWGERVHAFVVPRPGRDVDVDELRQHCRDLIAGFKCPRSIDVIDELPRSGAGKVLKRELRDRYWPAADRHVN